MSDKYSYLPPGEFSGHPIEPSVEAAVRRFKLLGRRLAIPVTPQPGEGLPDLFPRAIHRNGVASASGIWNAAFGKPKHYFNHRNYVDVDVPDKAFADLLGTPVGASDISPLRYTRQGHGQVSFFGATILLSQLAQHRRVSPRFLASRGYQKAIWSLLSLRFDPSNREYLIDRCPNPDCQAQLAFGKAPGIYFCHTCVDPDDPARGMTDLRECAPPIVELDSFENVDFACSLIDPELDSKRNMTRLLHPDLRSLGRGQVFELILIVARLLDQENGDPYSYDVSPKGISDATAAVRNWPADVIEIAERVQGYWRCPTHTMGRGFKSPIFAEVYALRALFGTDFFHLLRDQLRAGLTAKAAPPTPPKTRTERFRRPHPRTSKEGGFNLTKRGDKVLCASLLARGSKAIRADFKSSGLPFLELVSLYSARLVRCPDPQLLRFLVKDTKGLPDLATRLGGMPSPPQEGLTSLYQAVTAISDGKIAWSGVIKSIVEGNLHVFIAPGTRALIHRLQIEDFRNLEQIIAKSSNDRWADEVVLTNYEAGFYLGVSENEVSTLVTSGLLPSDGLKLSTVRQFLKNYISGAEVLSYLAMRRHPNRSRSVVFSEISEAGIPPLHFRPSVRARKEMRAYFRVLKESGNST